MGKEFGVILASKDQNRTNILNILNQNKTNEDVSYDVNNSPIDSSIYAKGQAKSQGQTGLTQPLGHLSIGTQELGWGLKTTANVQTENVYVNNSSRNSYLDAKGQTWSQVQIGLT